MWIELGSKMYNMDIYKRIFVDGSDLCMVDSTEEPGAEFRVKRYVCGDKEEAQGQYEILKRKLQRR